MTEPLCENAGSCTEDDCDCDWSEFDEAPCTDPDCDCGAEPDEYERPMITINPNVRYL